RAPTPRARGRDPGRSGSWASWACWWAASTWRSSSSRAASRSSCGPVREPVRPTRQWYLVLGFATALLVLVGPFDAAADTSPAWHMGQHVVLLTVPAPLLALGVTDRGNSRRPFGTWQRRLLRRPRRLPTRARAPAGGARD